MRIRHYVIVTATLGLLLYFFIVPLVSDTDHDGLNDFKEMYELGTDPSNPDTDDDGCFDGSEVNAGSDPLNPDSTLQDKDADQLTDEWEERYFGSLDSSPYEDPDFDGLLNFDEQAQCTDPRNIDTDGDMLLDGHHITMQTTDQRYLPFSEVSILQLTYPNNTVTFFGEMDLGSNASTPSPCTYQRALNQIDFLRSLDTEEHQNAADDGLLLDFDWDKDYMDNYFEKFVADLPYKIKNDRFFVYIDTITDSGPSLLPFEPIEEYGDFWNECRYTLMKYKFQPENIFTLSGRDATIENFENLIMNISQKIDKNDLVYIQLDGHGNVGIFGFNDRIVTYEDIDKIIDNIKARSLLISTHACYGDHQDSTNPLKEGPCPRVITTHYLLKHNNLAYGPWKENLQDRLDYMDFDKNGYLSIKEVLNYLKNVGEVTSLARFIDPYNIGSTLYLGDATVDELKDL